MISAKRGRVMFLFTAVMMGISFIQTALYSQDIEMADISNMASTKITDILGDKQNNLFKKRLIIGDVVRKVEERLEAGVSFFEFEDQWGGRIIVKTLDEKLPEDFKGKKFMILGTVELDTSTDDPSDVYFHEKSRKSIPSVIEPQPQEQPKEQPPVNLQQNPEPVVPQEPLKPNRIPPLMIILGSVGVACAVIGLGFFIWSLTRKSQKQENLTQAWGTSMGAPPPFPPVNVPTEVVKDTSVPTAVVIEHGYLGILSGDGKESARMDLYKHGDINENGEYVYTISRAIHGDEHRTIKLSEDDNLTTRGVHAKLFVNKTTGEFKVAQFYNSNPVAIRRNKGGDVIKLKQGDQPVVLEDKDVITIGRTSLILHKA